MMRATKFTFHLIWIHVISVTLGCSPAYVVSTEPAPGVDFGFYQTFDFMEVSVEEDSIIEVNSREIGLLKKAIAHEMEVQGYSHTEDPDLWVNIGIVVQQKVQTRETSFREAPVYIGQRNYHWQSKEVVVDKYALGTVTVDIIDSKANQRVWKGVVEGTLDNPRKLERRISQAMELLFDAYPND